MKPGAKYALYAIVFFLTLSVSAYLTMSLIVTSQPEVETPDVQGRGAVAALKMLSDAGLNLKVEAADYHHTIPKDHIISQDPLPGSRLKKKRAVRVVLSLGAANVSMPDLRGLPYRQALSILEQRRLNPGLVSYTYGFGPEHGRRRVLAQWPEPGAQTPAASKVDVLLSLGPRPVYLVMPDLTGQSYSTALYTLERAGLSLGGIDTDVRPSWPEDAVLVQEPSPGGRAAQGALVRFTVNQTQDDELEEYQWRLYNYDVPFGVFHREIKIRVAARDYLWEIYHEWRKPGDAVRVFALVKGGPRAQVIEDGMETALLPKTIYETGERHDQNIAVHPIR